ARAVLGVNRVYLSLGSNIGDRESNLSAALAFLQPTRVSPIYETEPVDLADQPWFLNLAAELETDLAPHALLARTQQIERDLGRPRRCPHRPQSPAQTLYRLPLLHRPLHPPPGPPHPPPPPPRAPLRLAAVVRSRSRSPPPCQRPHRSRDARRAA